MTAHPSLPFDETANFLRDAISAKLLSAALKTGVIDRLIAGPLSLPELRRRFGFAPTGADLLAAGLDHCGIIERSGSALKLTPRFSAALGWRDLLEARLEFAATVLPDFTELTVPLLGSGNEFMAQSATFDLFRYDRAKHRSPENHAATMRWVRLLSTLSRYEAAGLLHLLDRGGAQHIVDVGGNGGVLAQALCAAWPGAQAAVFDLPVVCDIGREMQSSGAAVPMVGPLTFVEGDLRHDPLPAGADLVVFKSVLHDWPNRDIAAFLGKAAASLNPGGRIAIFERLPFKFDTALPAFHDLPNLMFMHVLRQPSLYRDLLGGLGFEQISQQAIALDMPFCLTVATKPCA